MEMDDSVITQAHIRVRRAEAHLKNRRFVEAVHSYKEAVDLFENATNSINDFKLIMELEKQRDHYVRQMRIAVMKKEKFENYKKALENRRRGSLVSTTDYENTFSLESTSLQVAIYRTMAEADSLLGCLTKRSNTGSDSESLKSFSTTDTDDNKLDSTDALVNIVGCKHPKDDATIIEELRTVNEQLHTLVYRLVNQLDASQQEVHSLKDRIKQLEGDKNKADHVFESDNIKLVGISSGGTSPYVYSPSSESGADGQETITIPALSPLEMPKFDFSSISKASSS